MEVLPRGYGCAAEEPPCQAEARCICGHEQDDHNTDEDMAEADPRKLYDDLKWLLEATASFANGGLSCVNLINSSAYRNAEKWIVSCQARNCDCRKFEERDPHEDDRY